MFREEYGRELEWKIIRRKILPGEVRRDRQGAHGLRKFCKTQLSKAGLKWEDQEVLLGHRMAYYKNHSWAHGGGVPEGGAVPDGVRGGAGRGSS